MLPFPPSLGLPLLCTLGIFIPFAAAILPPFWQNGCEVESRFFIIFMIVVKTVLLSEKEPSFSHKHREGFYNKLS